MSRTTTADPASSDTVLLRARRDENGWVVQDAVTVRFGAGATLRAALLDYCDDLESLIQIEGEAALCIAAEIDYATAVLS